MEAFQIVDQKVNEVKETMSIEKQKIQEVGTSQIVSKGFIIN